MREPGFEEFADLWQDPDTAEQEAFEALARRARRQGRMLAYMDITLVVLLIGSTVLTTVMSPSRPIIAAALAVVAATLWLTWKRRKMRQMNATLNTGSRDDFLGSSIRIANANLRRVTLSIAFFPVMVGLGLVFNLIRHGHFGHPLSAVEEWARSYRGMFSLTAVALVLAITIRSRGRIKAELRRLEAVRADYDEEGRHEMAEREGSYPR
jgi:hypothetical protein